jgi:hypothetical protein
VAVAAGLLGLIGGTVAANAGTDITSPEIITTVGTTVKDKSVDIGKRGPTVGDTFATTVDIKSTTGVTSAPRGLSARSAQAGGQLAPAHSTSPVGARSSVRGW